MKLLSSNYDPNSSTILPHGRAFIDIGNNHTQSVIETRDLGGHTFEEDGIAETKAGDYIIFIAFIVLFLVILLNAIVIIPFLNRKSDPRALERCDPEVIFFP